MKKTAKRLLSVLMSVIMVMSLFSMLSVTSFAEESVGFVYEANADGETCTITSYIGESLNTLYVPKILGRYTVSKIGDYAFEGQPFVTVELPETITSIGEGAFSECINLREINFPERLTTIGDGAFFGCDSFCGVTLPNTVTHIGQLAFGYSYYITEDNTYQVVRYINFPIIGYTGSAAEAYANENEFVFLAYNTNMNFTLRIHRLYNPNSGEHFYTSNIFEAYNLVIAQWSYEGIGWIARERSSTPVYRLYNRNGGEHHYTTDVNERDWLISLGWNDEGIGWYSDDSQGVAIYRQYNPNAFANNHNYTADKAENDWLIGLGWRAEGIGWYGVAA